MNRKIKYPEPMSGDAKGGHSDNSCYHFSVFCGGIRIQLDADKVVYIYNPKEILALSRWVERSRKYIRQEKK